MYNINNNNPFGEWTGIMPLNENATPQEVDQYNKLFEEYCTDYVSEKEINEYMERLFRHDNVLNEFEERAWWGVSPLEWTKGLRFGSGKGGFNIFKPLKWLALPLLGGVVLLLAGLYKLLKEGKKQIAIARVKAWIEKLIVLADSGYKKTRNTKDSLFLIRQRYRRDILQGAVKVATSLGIDVEEKDTKPESVETSLNEAYQPDDQIIVENTVGCEQSEHFWALIRFKSTKTNLQIEYGFYKDEEGKVYVQKQYKNGENSYRIIPDDKQFDDSEDSKYRPIVEKIDNYLKEFNNNTKSKDAPEGALIKIIEDGKIEEYAKPGFELTENGINVAWQSPKQKENNDSQDLSSQENNLNNGESQKQDQETSTEDKETSTEDKDLDNTDVSEEETKETGETHTAVINNDTLLPDDSRVDWSLMNSVKASQWFGLKHKTTNFWKEAKSVGVVLDPNNPNNDPLRNCSLIISTVSNSLTLVASPGIAQQYASMLQKYVQFLSNIEVSDDNRNMERIGNTRQDNRFGKVPENEEIDYKRQNELYEMFKDDMKIFEQDSTKDAMVIQNLIQGMSTYNQNALNQYMINNKMNMNDLNANFLRTFDLITSLGQKLENLPRKENNKVNNIDGDKIDQYLAVALSKALSTTNFSEWQLHRNAYDQMIKFINELTKTVHTIIDSVAKKAEKMTTGGGAADTLVARLLRNEGDPKQNRSLHNLWDNIGVSKLQQRTIVHCEEIMTSPEMQYYLDMFLLTVPAIIKQQLGKGAFTANAKYEQKTEEEKPVEQNENTEKAAENVIHNAENDENVKRENNSEQENNTEQNENIDNVKQRANEALAGLESLGWARKESQEIISEILQKYPDMKSKDIIIAALHWDRNTHDMKK